AGSDRAARGHGPRRFRRPVRAGRGAREAGPVPQVDRRGEPRLRRPDRNAEAERRHQGVRGRAQPGGAGERELLLPGAARRLQPRERLPGVGETRVAAARRSPRGALPGRKALVSAVRWMRQEITVVRWWHYLLLAGLLVNLAAGAVRALEWGV